MTHTHHTAAIRAMERLERTITNFVEYILLYHTVPRLRLGIPGYLIKMLIHKLSKIAISLTFPIARSYNYLVSDEKKRALKEKEMVPIEIFYAQFPSFARIYRETDRF